MAEGLFRKAIADRSDFTTSSAGVAAYGGSSMSPETEFILKNKDSQFDGFKSQPVTPELIDQASHIFAMTEGHLNALEGHFPDQTDKFFLIREFAGKSNNGATDVPDPIGMGQAAYEEVAQLLEAAIPAIIAYIDANKKTDTADQTDQP